MFISMEQAIIRRQFLESQIKKLPEGKEVVNHGKYPAVYIKSCPERSELNGKRMLLKKKDARDILDLIKLRRQYEAELFEIDSYLSKPLKMKSSRA